MSLYTTNFLKPVCYMLVGVPGSGKTTWVQKEHPSLAYASTDKYIEQFAAESGHTYNYIFKASIKTATSRMFDDVSEFLDDQKDFIWDQTNLTKKSRATKIALVAKKDYTIVAVVFETPKNLQERLAQRPGKNIPSYIVESMIENFEMPSLNEGFSKITIVENE